MADSTDSLANLIAKRFIQRTDVKAQQFPDKYNPVRTPWTRTDLRAHLSGDRTYGHYLLDKEDNCKLFAFDLDFEKEGSWCKLNDAQDEWLMGDYCNPREAWKDRSHPGRPWFKYQLRHMAEMLSSEIVKQLDIPVACAYSGNKGVHVYGFTGSIPAAHAREAGKIVLASLGCFEAEKGASRFIHKDEGVIDGFRNITIELFPKQDSLEGKDLGNLLRLPLGVNRRNPSDPTFFLDQTTAHNQLTPHTDPAALLETGNPWL